MKWLAIVLCLAVLVGCGAALTGVPAVMHARDESGAVISSITLFTQYEPRGTVLGSVADGTRVTLLATVGSGALVQTIDGVRGWCNKAFVQRL